METINHIKKRGGIRKAKRVGHKGFIMNKQRMFILAASVLGIVASFLPWITLPMGSISGIKGDGWLTLILFLVPTIISVLGNRNGRLSRTNLYIAMGPALLAALIGLYKIIDFNTSLPGGDNPIALGIRNTVSIGLGLYVLVVAGLAVPSIGLFFKESPKVSQEESSN